MSQYSSVDNAANVMELSREYAQKYESAKLYGKSKVCDGVVKLTWKGRDRLQI